MPDSHGRPRTESSRPTRRCRPRPGAPVSPPRSWSMRRSAITQPHAHRPRQHRRRRDCSSTCRRCCIPIVIGILLAYGLEPFVSTLARAAHPAIDRRGRRAAGCCVGVLGLGVYSAVGPGAADRPAGAGGGAADPRARVSRGRHGDSAHRDRSRRPRRSSQKTAEVALEARRATSAATADPAKVQVVQPAFDANSYLYAGGVNLLGCGRPGRPSSSSSSTSSSSPAISTRRRSSRSPGRTLWQKKLTVQILDDINAQIESFIRVQMLTSARGRRGHGAGAVVTSACSSTSSGACSPASSTRFRISVRWS